VTARRSLTPPECPEAAPLRSVAALVPDGRVRLRLEGYAYTLDRAPEHRRGVLLTAVAEVEDALAHLSPHPGPSVTLPAHAGYPSVSVDIAARLILGERPVDLAPGLTRAEAHAWLCDGAPDVGSWVLGRAGVPCDQSTVYLRVALWLRDRWRCAEQRAALERPRRQMIAGQLIEGSYLEHLDTLRPTDLRPSVEDTYRRAAERAGKALERALASKGEPLAPAPKWWQPVRCARLLLTGPDLVREGRAMKHCVATYAGHVRERETVIVGLCVLGHRSTVELGRASANVRQHKGPGNSEPHELCKRALVVCARRWRARWEADVRGAQAAPRIQGPVAYEAPDGTLRYVR
jgi:hypothetical protein